MPQVVEVPGMGDVEFPDDMSDEQIADAIRKNSASSPQPLPDIYAGAGGYNPLQSMIVGSGAKVGNALGMTPENLEGFGNAFAPAEVGLQAASGAAALPISGIAGLGQGLWNKFAPNSMRGPDAADRVRQVQGAMTYQPRSGAGSGLSTVVSAPARAYEAGTNYLGEKTTDLTGSPAAGAFVKTAGDIAPALIGARGLPKRGNAPKLDGDYAPTKYEVPTTEQLKKATTEAYDANKDSGIMVTPENYDKALAGVRDMVTKEGIDPTLHPKTTAVMKRLEGSAGKPLTLQEAETLRKIALDAEDDLNPVTRQPTPDARLAGKVVDELDERIDALSTNDAARALNRRKKNSEMIDRMIARAEIKAGAHYTQAGMEHALRKEFEQLALNDRRMRFLSPEQKAAVKKVAMGGPLENTLRTIGKFDPTTGGVAAATSIGTGAGLAGVTGGASMALPLLGFAGRRAATKMTERNVSAAREALVGRGMPQVPITKQRPSAAPSIDAMEFTMTPGVFQSRTGPLSRGIELEQQVPNSQLFPDAPQIRDLTASDPPQIRGDIDFKPPFMGDIGGLELAGQAPRYPGGVDFTPTDLSSNYASQMSGLLGRETPATPAMAPRGLLDIPQPRAKKEILAELRKLEARAKSLTQSEIADSGYTRGLSQRLDALRAELADAESRAASR